MTPLESELYQKDINMTLDRLGITPCMDGKSILITGATGLICSAVADLLLTYSEMHGGNIHVYLAGRDEQKIKERFARFSEKPFCSFVRYDASKTNDLTVDCNYIIHGASNAYPARFLSNPVDTMLDNFDGIKELLTFAHKTNVSKTLFISSSEVYGRKTNMTPFSESEYGYIDILNPRACYSMGKRAAETLCACYAKEKGVYVTIARPGHIYGPTASKGDNRISSAFAFDAVLGKNIVLKSDGAQIRSYCYVLDCASAILTILLKGENANAYNISNPDSIMSILEISQLYAREAGIELEFDLPTESEKSVFNPMNNSSLNSEKLLALGWKGMFDGKMGTEHTIRILREMMNREKI